MINLDAPAIKQVNAPEVATFYLYEISYSDSLPPLRWTNCDESILYGDETWTPQAIQHSDVTTNADGSVSPVTMSVGNIDEDRLIQQVIEQYKLLGKKVRIIQILISGTQIINYEYRIAGARAVKGYVAFTLSAGFDIFNIRIPGRRMMAGFCPWKFGDEDCAYNPGNNETCEMTWQACKQKGNTLNFGGFPGVTNDFYVI